MGKETRLDQDRRDILRYGLWGIGAFIGQYFFPVNSYAETALWDRHQSVYQPGQILVHLRRLCVCPFRC